MVEEFNKLNTKPRNIADLKLKVKDDLQTIWDSLPDKTILNDKRFRKRLAARAKTQARHSE